MNFSIHIKSVIAHILESASFVGQSIKKHSAHSYLILMYHRVMPSKKEEPAGLQPGMYVEPETLEMHIEYLKKYFQIIPLSEIMSYAKNLSLISNHKPICIITFDDGWYDFYKYAYPILEAQKTPATVFLPTDFIGTRNRFWTDHLAYLFVQIKNRFDRGINERSMNISGVRELAVLRGSTESKIEKAIHILKNFRDDEITIILNELKSIWDIDETDIEPAFLTWEEVRNMAESGLISFGSHTGSHKILTHLNEKEIWDELIQSRNKLITERVIDPSFLPFSYPNGNYNDKVVRIVKEAGYHVAVTTENGWNNMNTDFYILKRVSIHQDMTKTKAMFGCRITNIM